MLIIMKKTATEKDMQSVKQFLTDRDFDFHQSTGTDRVIIGVMGDTAKADSREFRNLPGVLEVFKIPDEE